MISDDSRARQIWEEAIDARIDRRVKHLQDSGVIPRPDPFGYVIGDWVRGGTEALTIRLNGDLIEVPYDNVDEAISTLTQGDRVLIHKFGSRHLVAHRVTP